jgi:hypothetical protein
VLKRVATTVQNRLIVLAVLWVGVNLMTRASCYPGDAPFGQFGKALSGLSDLTAALQKR